jgi:hypothetical protein
MCIRSSDDHFSASPDIDLIPQHMATDPDVALRTIKACIKLLNLFLFHHIVADTGVEEEQLATGACIPMVWSSLSVGVSSHVGEETLRMVNDADLRIGQNQALLQNACTLWVLTDGYVRRRFDQSGALYRD